VPPTKVIPLECPVCGSEYKLARVEGDTLRGPAVKYPFKNAAARFASAM
jgi:hypothetical protein